MAVFGTIEVYDEMATLLNGDEEWVERGRGINYSMIFHYTDPVDRTFFVHFDEGRVSEVRELASPDAETADFVISGRPEVWRAIFEKRMSPMVALTRGHLKLKGKLTTLIRHMDGFNYIIDSMTKIPLA
jgi:putative sterol carrier protein